MTRIVLGLAVLATALVGGMLFGAIGAFLDETSPDLPE